MKRILYIFLFFLIAAPVSLQAQKKQKLSKAERETQRIEEFRGMIEGRNFNFGATAYETTYGGIAKNTTRGSVSVYPGRTDFDIPDFRAENISVGAYAVTETDKGWVVIFTARAMGLDGDRLYDGVSVNFTFKFTIAYSGKTVLEVSTDYNQHKYPHIYRGSISSNVNAG